MDPLKDPREKYWDQTYTNYWLNRVGESHGEGLSNVLEGDVKTEGEWVYEEIFYKNKFNKGSILDVGCAWGRMFNIYLEYNLDVFGIDISCSMIKKANSLYSKNPKIISLQKGIAEKLPFKDNFFDNIACLAVFDATYQNKSLSEFIRVLKPNGKVYLTGKSTRYLSEDNLAFNAEIGARKKGHPNYFTDVTKMLEILKLNQMQILSTYFFKKRGDFASFEYITNNEDPYYEWLIIFQKKGLAVNLDIENFSDEYSETFRKKELKNND